jgi:T5SS/PEP-CTERM-associated repeat protein
VGNKLVAVDNSGIIDLEKTSTLTVNGDVTNSGTMATDMNGGGGKNTITITGTLNNNDLGSLVLHGPKDTATIGSVVNLSGTVGLIDLENGSSLTVNGDFANGMDQTIGQLYTSHFGGSGGNTLTINGTLSQGHNSTFQMLGPGDTATIGSVVAIGGIFDLENGSSLTVTGDWNNTFSPITTGGSGHNTLTIGGTLTNNNGGLLLGGPGDMATIGGDVNNNGSFQVLGSGSTATIGGDLSVGIGGGTGSLAIMNGASVTNQNGFVGSGAGSSGTAVVSGNGSSWLNLGNLSVGINGGSGLLTVNNGGTVTAQVLTIGTLGEVDAKGGTLMYTSLLNSGILDPVGTATLIGNSLTVFPQGRVLSGLTVIDFMNGFAPKKGDMFDLINITGSFDFSKNTIDIEGLQPGFEYSIDFANGEFTLTALNDGVPLPEPATLLVLIPGLLTAGYGLRRKLLR